MIHNRVTGEFAGDTATCMVCMEEIKPVDRVSMDCGHVACQQCWMQHIQVKIADGNACNIPCMAFKCGAICAQPYDLPTRVIYILLVVFKRNDDEVALQGGNPFVGI